MTICLLLPFLLLPHGTAHDTPIEAKMVRVNRIWDHDPHSAFTDLIRWQDRFVCVFRAGQKHVSADGALQLLASEDGSRWQPLARITSQDADLRDPKLVLGKEGELLVYAAGALHDKQHHSHQTYVWSSKNGTEWAAPVAVGQPDSWLWRVTSHSSGYYGFGYGTSKERFVRLYQSNNGQTFQAITSKLLSEHGYPNESAMVIEGSHAWCLLRRDGKAPMNTGMLGISSAPFIEWTWQKLEQQIGGPALLRLPSGQFLAVVRLYDAPKVRCALCSLDVQKVKFTELLSLPSGGDCSYAGMVWHQQKLWISYYSSHEGKSSIYFAEVDVKQE